MLAEPSWIPDSVGPEPSLWVAGEPKIKCVTHTEYIQCQPIPSTQAACENANPRAAAILCGPGLACGFYMRSWDISKAASCDCVGNRQSEPPVGKSGPTGVRSLLVSPAPGPPTALPILAIRSRPTSPPAGQTLSGASQILRRVLLHNLRLPFRWPFGSCPLSQGAFLSTVCSLLREGALAPARRPWP